MFGSHWVLRTHKPHDINTPLDRRAGHIWCNFGISCLFPNNNSITYQEISQPHPSNHGKDNCRNWHLIRLGVLSFPPFHVSVSKTPQGFETIKQLLEQAEPYNFILGARDTGKVQAAYDSLNYDTSKHSITIYPLDLLSLKSVQSFAANVLSKLGSERLAYLFLCAGTLDNGEGPGPNGSQWCSGYVVNHLGSWNMDRL